MASTMMKDVLQQLERREDLKLATHRNRRVLSGVNFLLRIVKESSEEDAKARTLNLFALSLSEDLQVIVKGAIHSGTFRKETMYRSYHTFVTSSLTVAWERLELQMHETFDPSLPQMISDTYLRSTIKQICDSLPSSPCTSTAMRQLTEVEENAIMYAAGYVVRVLIQKYKKSSDLVSADFVSCLTHMLEGSPLDIEGNESFEDCASRWVKVTNRGGLLILRRGAYWLFRDVELVLWPFLEKLKSRTTCLDMKVATESIVSNESVRFKWSMMDVDIPNQSNSEQLLTVIVQKWITIRGFSYASKILETYQIAKGRAIAKEKALRKELYSHQNKQ